MPIRKKKWIPKDEQERRIDSLNWREARDLYESDSLRWEKRMNDLVPGLWFEVAQDYLNNSAPLTEQVLKNVKPDKRAKRAHKDYLTYLLENLYEHWVPSTYDEYDRRNQAGKMYPPTNSLPGFGDIDAAIDQRMWGDQRASNIMDSLFIEQYLPYYDDPKIKRKIEAALKRLQKNRVPATYPGYNELLERRNEITDEPEYEEVRTPEGNVSRPTLETLMEWYNEK